jgi:hypothetical protein
MYGGKEYNGKYERSGTNDLLFSSNGTQTISKVYGEEDLPLRI